MRIVFLGTAAAEGYPGIFCNCPNCIEARALGGRSRRYRSALLVNDNLLIDFGPDLLAAAQRFNLNFTCVTTGLVSHAHMDHFIPGNFIMHKDDFTAGLPLPIMRVFGPADVTGPLAQIIRNDATFRLDPHPIHPFDTWSSDGYTITAFRANHALEYPEAVFYSIDDGRHSLLYATDTGPFFDDTWEALAGHTFDTIILEETMGNGEYAQHLGFDGFVEHVRRMRVQGMLRPGGRILATHFSHSGNPTHEKLEAILTPHGVEVAYDGLEINL